MIAVKIEGRLGNQMFQYAFIYAVAKRLKSNFYIDKGIEKFVLSQYFEIKNDFFYPIDKYFFSINGYKNIFTIHLKRFFYTIVNKCFLARIPILIDNNEEADNARLKIENRRLYVGFFQSEKYFKDFEKDIRTFFTVKKQYQQAFHSVFSQIGITGKTVMVHVRRGDYVGLGLALDTAYYHNAIAEVKSENNFFIFISDDIQFVETEFAYLSNKYVSNNSEIIDFQFLLHANTCILSASSFSWWGAYLNKNNPKVIAPKYWLGKEKGVEYPLGILPENWQQH